MNPHHLELFYFVAHHGGISEAVRQMPYGIQQPAVSGQILQLEADLGVKLFQRRPFRLTPPGEELYAFIRPFFSGVDGVAERIRGGTTQLLRLAAPETVLRNHLPNVLREVRQSFPKLRLTLKAAQQVEVELWLQNQEIDLAITLMEKKLSPGLYAEPLLTLPVELRVRLDSPFTEAAAVLDCLNGGGAAPDDAPLPSLISLPSHELLPRHFRDLLASRNVEWPPSIEVNGIELIDIYVQNGFGIGLALGGPARSLNPELRSLPLHDIEPLTVGVLWKNPLSPVARQLVDILRQRARTLTPSQ